jgi:thymidine phosphorylase
LTSAQVQAFSSLTTAARKAYDAAQTAKQAYRAAITNQDQAIAAAVANAADLVRFIKSFAENTNNPDAVYALAQIPAPAERTPAPLPGKPENVTPRSNLRARSP